MYKTLTNEEAAQLAKDIYSGHVFTDRHVTPPQDLSLVFMVLVFTPPEEIEKIKANPPGLTYEYMDKALPRSINGMPCFMSCHMIDKESARLVAAKYDAVVDAMEAIE